jgi:methionyl-tRNA formyltransferase
VTYTPEYPELKKPLSVVFMGTPQFAVPTLQALIDAPKHCIKVVACLTQPDKPVGRGQKLTPPPVKQLAQQAGIPVFQPAALRKDTERLAWLTDLAPSVIVTVAFGQILPQVVLDSATMGTINVHASLLPLLRGANPIQQAIIQGHTQTGLTTMLTELGVDTGPILQRQTLDITPTDTAQTLADRLAVLGGPLLLTTLFGLLDGTLSPTPQDNALATHAPKANKQDAWLDWTQDAYTLHNRIRGQQPWPGACSLLADGVNALQILESLPLGLDGDASLGLPTPCGPNTPGAILGLAKHPSDPKNSLYLWVQTGNGLLGIQSIKPPSKGVMLAKDWFNGVFNKLEPLQKKFITPLVVLD